MVPLSMLANTCGPRYRPLKFEKEKGDQAQFWGEKFEYVNDSSFERARRAESNGAKINAIGLF